MSDAIMFSSLEEELTDLLEKGKQFQYDLLCHTNPDNMERVAIAVQLWVKTTHPDWETRRAKVNSSVLWFTPVGYEDGV